MASEDIELVWPQQVANNLREKALFPEELSQQNS